AMAPCFSYTSVHHLPEKDHLRLQLTSTSSSSPSQQLRKPRVEKMRRDRINTCIEQLKLLLETELHQQEPNAKLEKADVLEGFSQGLLLSPVPASRELRLRCSSSSFSSISLWSPAPGAARGASPPQRIHLLIQCLLHPPTQQQQQQQQQISCLEALVVEMVSRSRTRPTRRM
ncbi:hypothetical protein CRUP_008668, partial [Coryphaenoides rupestris]